MFLTVWSDDEVGPKTNQFKLCTLWSLESCPAGRGSGGDGDNKMLKWKRSKEKEKVVTSRRPSYGCSPTSTQHIQKSDITSSQCTTSPSSHPPSMRDAL